MIRQDIVFVTFLIIYLFLVFLIYFFNLIYFPIQQNIINLLENKGKEFCQVYILFCTLALIAVFVFFRIFHEAFHFQILFK